MPQTRAEYKVYEAEEAELKLQSNAQNTAPQPNPLPLAPTNNKKRVRKIFGHESKKPRRCSERLNPPAKAASSSSQTLDHDIARFSPEALAAAFDSDASLTDLAELWDSEDDEQAYGSVSNDLPHSPSRQKGCPRACSESPSAAKPLSHRAAYIPRSVAAKKDGRVNCMTSQHLIERDVQYYEPCPCESLPAEALSKPRLRRSRFPRRRAYRRRIHISCCAPRNARRRRLRTIFTLPTDYTHL